VQPLRLFAGALDVFQEVVILQDRFDHEVAPVGAACGVACYFSFFNSCAAGLTAFLKPLNPYMVG
jgi:hypothetical protein